MIFFREIILYLISQAAVLDMHYMEAANTLKDLKVVINQNTEAKMVLAEARQLIAKLDLEFKKIKDANDKIITRTNRRRIEEITRLFPDPNRDRSEGEEE